MKRTIQQKSPMTIPTARESKQTHLLICSIISMGCGLQTDLISAWKSGRKPSAKREIKRRRSPNISVFCLSSFWPVSPSQYLNSTIPAVTMIPTTIFFPPSFSFFSFTLEQSTPTRMTERILHDLNIITIGNVVQQIAYVYVIVEVNTVSAHVMLFAIGICVTSLSGIVKEFTIHPVIQVTAQGKIRNPTGHWQLDDSPVTSSQYFSLILSHTKSTYTRGKSQIAGRLYIFLVSPLPSQSASSHLFVIDPASTINLIKSLIYISLILPHINMSISDIAEALCLLPFDPTRGTQLLHLHRHSPHFFPHLRDISCAYSLYPEPVRHSAIVILARFARKTLQQHLNETIYYVDRLASYCLHILSSPFLPLSSKRALTSALTEIMSDKCFSQLDFNEAAQTIFIGTAPQAAFILFESAIESKMSNGDKITILRNHLILMIGVGQKDIIRLVSCFRGSLNDPRDHNLLATTKNSREGNSTIMKCLSFLCQQAQKQQSNRAAEFLDRVCMGDELSQYFWSVLSFERQAGGSGTFGVEIVSDLSPEYSRHLNEMKSHCLRVYGQILGLADKCFNLANTPKKMFQMLPELMNTIISDLLICSDAKVYAHFDRGDAYAALGGMFRLLEKCTTFSELERPFSTLNCEQILRITIAYFVSNNHEMDMFYQAPEEYVAFLEYVCIEETFDAIASEELFATICLKKDLSGFVWAMCRHVAGFTSCLFELTYDLIVVRLTSLRTSSRQHIHFFQLQYRVPDDLMHHLTLQAALLSIIILSPALKQRSSAIQTRMNSMIDLVELSVLTQIESARVFTLICSFAKIFVSSEARLRNYRFVQEAFKITIKKPAARMLALKSVQMLFEKVLQETDIESLQFAGRILEDILKEFSQSSQEDIADLLLTTIHNKNMCKYVGTLSWINTVFERVLQKIYKNNPSSKQMKNMFMIMLQLSQMAESSFQAASAGKGQMPNSTEVNRHLELLKKSIGKNIVDKSGLMGDVDLEEDDSELIEKQGKYVSWLMRLDYYSLEDTTSIATIMLNCLTIYELLTPAARAQVFNVALELTIRVGLHQLDKDDGILRWLKELLAGTEESINQVCLFVLSVAHQSVIDTEYLQLEKETLQLIAAEMKKCLIHETQNYRDSPCVALNRIVVLRMYCCFLLTSEFDMISVVHQQLNELCFSQITLFDLNALLAAIWKLLPKLSHADMSLAFDFLIKMFEQYCFYEKGLKTEQVSLVNRPLQLKVALTQMDPFRKLSEFLGECRNYECTSEGNMISEHFSISEHWREVNGLIESVRRVSAFQTVQGKPRVINRIIRPI